MSGETHCPLCGGPPGEFFCGDRRRDYLRCGTCALVYVPSRWLLDAAAERAQYDLHDNRVDDPAYRRFLSRLADPLLARLEAPCHGLDFGSGPGPALAAMLEEAGHRVSLYDPFYAPDRTVFAARYAFVTATEVVEHLHRPGEELDRLWSLLEPGGWLGIMTKLVTEREAFRGWHYKNDPTHVCFFSRRSWVWWAAEKGVRPEFEAADVILLRRPTNAQGPD